eukprot:ANDGO_04309.mRNA.1 hypothetical protein
MTFRSAMTLRNVLGERRFAPNFRTNSSVLQPSKQIQQLASSLASGAAVEGRQEKAGVPSRKRDAGVQTVPVRIAAIDTFPVDRDAFLDVEESSTSSKWASLDSGDGDLKNSAKRAKRDMLRILESQTSDNSKDEVYEIEVEVLQELLRQQKEEDQLQLQRQKEQQGSSAPKEIPVAESSATKVSSQRTAQSIRKDDSLRSVKMAAAMMSHVIHEEQSLAVELEQRQQRIGRESLLEHLLLIRSIEQIESAHR